jgi:mannose-6-phosphate isomerase-like protein (cupin superfamily)
VFVDHRPWGYGVTLEVTDSWKVKNLCIKPGMRTSLQTHEHRAEHWFVVSGRGLINVAGHEREAVPGVSVDVPIGVVHRIANTGDEDLHIVEVQHGPLCDESDIIRLQDDYGRVRAATGLPPDPSGLSVPGRATSTDEQETPGVLSV